MTGRETLRAIREGILSGKCSDGNLAWIVNLCDESLAESGSDKAVNAAAMCKALCDIVMLTMKVGYSIHGDVACGIIASKAKHALSSPARNCDVMSRSTCIHHFSTIYEGNRDGLCDVKTEREKNIHLYYIEFNKWLFAPAEKRKGECDGR